MARRRGKTALLVAVSLAVVAGLSSVDAHSSGMPDRARTGCGEASGCHGPDSAPGVAPQLNGVPASYTPGMAYVLEVAIMGGSPTLPVAQNLGGFALEASAGSLALAPDGAGVQIAGGAATHTAEGNDQRSWNVQWTAPVAGAGTVTFYVAVNAVNGNTINDALDEWNIATFTSAEGASVGPGPGGPGPVGDDGTDDGTLPDEPADDEDGGNGIPAPGVLALLAAAVLALAAAGVGRGKRGL